MGRHVYDGRGKVVRYGQFTSLPGGAEESAYWRNPETLEQYVPTGDAGTNAPLIASNGAFGCGPVSAGSVEIGPEGDGIATGRLSNPLVGFPVTSEFGRRARPCPSCSEYHPGIDLGVPEGTPIKAADGGVVEFSGWLDGYGNVVIINHGNGLATLSAHHSQNQVQVGQKVSNRQTIALSGSTGRGTGPHAHIEVIEGYQSENRHSGQNVNPRKHIQF